MGKNIKVTCPTCQKERDFNTANLKKVRSFRCYGCSRLKKGETNNGAFRRGCSAWNKGKKGVMPPPWNKGLKGVGSKEKNGMWKGDLAGYRARHIWLTNNLGKPSECEECGKKAEKKNGRNTIEWANISGEHKRERSDWKQLCIPCHRKFDYKRGAYHLRGSRHYWAKLTEKQVKEIRKKHVPHKHKNIINLALEYGVSKQTIQSVIRRQNWKHL